LELSFATPADVMAVTEGVVAAAFDTARAFSAAAGSGAAPPHPLPPHVAAQAAHMATVSPPLPAWAPLALPLPRLTYAHALCVYGSDKPDRRWGMRLGELSRLLLAEAGDAPPDAAPAPAGVPPSPLHTVLRHLRATGSSGSSSGAAGVVRPGEGDVDLSPLLPGAYGVRAFAAPGLSAAVTRKEWDALTADVARAVTKGAAPAAAAAAGGDDDAQLATLATAPAVFCLRVEPDGSWRGSPAVTKALPPAAQRAATAALGAAPGDAVVLGAGAGLPLCTALGTARLLVADARRRRGLPLPTDAVGGSTVVAASPPPPRAAANGAREADARQPGGGAAPAALHPDLFWVTDFPLFELADVNSPTQAPSPSPSPLAAALPRLQSVHHPFTAPHPDDAPLLARLMDAVDKGSNGGAPALAAATADALLRVRGQHYDLVCSGVELGGGSVRVHDPALQGFIFAHLLRVSPSQLEGFRPLLDALAAGAPPHGGLALGLDRLVATVAGPGAAASVRDVLAFPKSAAGNDLLTGAPAALEPHQWAELHLAPVVVPAAKAEGGSD
jgi:aspartyl-tRNA synthetase